MINISSVFQSARTSSRSVCLRWVNQGVVVIGERNQHARIFGFIFSVPPLAVLFFCANAYGLVSIEKAVSLLAIACAVPVLAAAWLSLSGTKIVMTLISRMLPAMAFLAMTQAGFAVAAALLAILVMLFYEIIRKDSRGEMHKNGIIATSLVIACALFASSQSGFEAGSSLISLVPVAAMILLYICFYEPVHEKIAMPVVDNFDGLATLVAPHNAMLIVLDHTGSVTKLSENTTRILSLKSDDLLARGLISRIHVADLVLFMSALDAVRTGLQHVETKVRIKSGHSANQWQMVMFSAIPNSDFIQLLGHVETQPIAAGIEPLHDLSANALAVVSHELRTPLNAIVGFSDLLRQEMFGPMANERQREYIELVHQSGQHLLELVNALLDMSKLESGSYELNPEIFQPTEAATFAIAMVSAQARTKKLGLNYLPLTVFDDFNGDRRITQQILINLLSNAVKFTPENGRINLKVDLDDNRLLLCIEDTGIGMSQAALSKIGTPFYQVQAGHTRSFEGAGLGLALVKQLVRLHGGSFEIYSEQGVGTKIKVALPPLAVKPTNIAILHPIESDESTRTIRIAEERIHETQRKTA